MNIKNSLLTSAFVSILSLHSISAMADHGNFHCDRIPFLNEKAVAAINDLSHNKTMSVIVKQYAEKWEDQEIIRTCDAAEAGKSADFSCLQGRRDWEAIKSMVPKDLLGMDMGSLRPVQLENQKARAQERPRKAALEHCEALGVMQR